MNWGECEFELLPKPIAVEGSEAWEPNTVWDAERGKAAEAADADDAAMPKDVWDGGGEKNREGGDVLYAAKPAVLGGLISFASRRPGRPAPTSRAKPG